MSVDDAAFKVAERAAGLIGQVIQQNTEWKRKSPYAAYRYHRARMEALPDWRAFSRAWHYSRMLKFRALWEASDDADRCRAAERMMG